MIVPYETSDDVSRVDRIPSLSFFAENREHQMMYTKIAVESGVYGKWLRQLTDEELRGFILRNEKKLRSNSDLTIYRPQFKEKCFWRNAIYRRELMIRENDGNVDNELELLWSRLVEEKRAEWEMKISQQLELWKKENAYQQKTGGKR